MSEAAKEWAAYVAARNAIETAKAARLAVRFTVEHGTTTLANRGDMCHED